MLVSSSYLLKTLGAVSREKYPKQNALVEYIDKLILAEELSDEPDKKEIADLKKKRTEAEKEAFMVDPDTWKHNDKSCYDAWNKLNYITESKNVITVSLDVSKAVLKEVSDELLKRMKMDEVEFEDFAVKGEYLLVGKYAILDEEETKTSVEDEEI